MNSRYILTITPVNKSQQQIETLKRAALESGDSHFIRQVDAFERRVLQWNKLNHNSLRQYATLMVRARNEAGVFDPLINMIEERRFDDIVELGRRRLDEYDQMGDLSFFLNRDAIAVYSRVLLEVNTPSALKDAKKLLQLLVDNKLHSAGQKVIACLFYLAILRVR